jgi:hypothetical protein
MYVFGAVEIIAGIILAFFGNKVFEYILFFLAFSTVFAGVMGLGFSFLNFFSGSVTPIVACVVIGILAGGLVAYFFKELVSKHGAMILGFFAGGMLAVMILTPIAACPAPAKAILMLLLGAVGAYLGNTYNLEIKIFALTGIGAGMIMHGLGQYLGGFPPLTASASEGDEMKPSAAYIGYVIGFIAVGAAGWFVQTKTNDPEEFSRKGNAFNDDDE